ncbi:MAG: hypothetical protein U0263_02075 [Polyangiaceae bacterium]
MKLSRKSCEGDRMTRDPSYQLALLAPISATCVKHRPLQREREHDSVG